MGIDIKLACLLYNAGYAAGHHDTVEGEFTDIVPSDFDSYHGDTVEELVDYYSTLLADPSTAIESEGNQ